MKSKISISNLTLYSSCITIFSSGLAVLNSSLDYPFSVLGVVCIGVLIYELHKRVLKKYVE